MKRNASADIFPKVKSAIARLRRGKPEHPDNKRRQLAGKDLRTFSAIALEAGVSRNNIAGDDCGHPEARNLCLNFMAGSETAEKRNGEIKGLREELARTKHAIAIRDTIIATQQIYIDDQ